MKCIFTLLTSHKKHLKEGPVHTKLIEYFQDNTTGTSIHLHDSAYITPKGENEWVIEEKKEVGINKKYRIIDTDDGLEVYDDTKPFDLRKLILDLLKEHPVLRPKEMGDKIERMGYVKPTGIHYHLDKFIEDKSIGRIKIKGAHGTFYYRSEIDLDSIIDALKDIGIRDIRSDKIEITGYDFREEENIVTKPIEEKEEDILDLYHHLNSFEHTKKIQSDIIKPWLELLPVVSRNGYVLSPRKSLEFGNGFEHYFEKWWIPGKTDDPFIELEDQPLFKYLKNHPIDNEDILELWSSFKDDTHVLHNEYAKVQTLIKRRLQSMVKVFEDIDVDTYRGVFLKPEILELVLSRILTKIRTEIDIPIENDPIHDYLVTDGDTTDLFPTPIFMSLQLKREEDVILPEDVGELDLYMANKASEWNPFDDREKYDVYGNTLTLSLGDTDEMGSMVNITTIYLIAPSVIENERDLDENERAHLHNRKKLEGELTAKFNEIIEHIIEDESVREFVNRIEEVEDLRKKIHSILQEYNSRTDIRRSAGVI